MTKFKNPPKASVSAKCPTDVWEKFKNVAKSDNRTAASLLQKLIYETVARHEQSAN